MTREIKHTQTTVLGNKARRIARAVESGDLSCNSAFIQLVDAIQYHEKNDHILNAAAPELLEALECEEALGLPLNEGKAILERCGWDYSNRFDLPATEFVERKRKAAIAKARGQS